MSSCIFLLFLEECQQISNWVFRQMFNKVNQSIGCILQHIFNPPFFELAFMGTYGCFSPLFKDGAIEEALLDVKPLNWSISSLSWQDCGRLSKFLSSRSIPATVGSTACSGWHDSLDFIRGRTNFHNFCPLGIFKFQKLFYMEVQFSYIH